MSNLLADTIRPKLSAHADFFSVQMENTPVACCWLNHFSCLGDDFGNLTLGGHLRSCCLHPTPHHTIGRFIGHSTEDESCDPEFVEEKCIHRPIVYLDGVDEWKSNENLYVIGLSAWNVLKPFVLFFSHDLSVKVGTATPYIVDASMRREYLVWRVMGGFPHEDLGVSFENNNKVWIRIPLRHKKKFQSFIINGLGLFVYKTYSTPHCGGRDFGSWNFKANGLSYRVLFGVECDEAVASFFAGQADNADALSRQFTSNFIIQPNESESECDCDAANLIESRSTGHEFVQSAASQQDLCNVGDQLIKVEMKEEPESCPDVIMPSPQAAPKHCFQKKSAFRIVKCPGCSCSFHDNKSGLNSLSHHILNSHKRHAKVYRQSLRFSSQRCYGSQSDRKHLLRKRL